MALVVRDRVKETSTTTGTGTFTLAGAVTGFESFASVGNSNTTYYCCTDNTDFEIGIGTYTSSGTTLSRDTILQSSNSDSKVDWGAGTRTIFCTYPADKAVFEDASNNINGTFVGNITGNVTGNTSGTAATVTGAAQTNITSVGTLSSLTTSGDITVGDDLTVNGGLIDLKTNSGSVAQLKFYCESGNAHAQTLQAQPHSASASDVLTLPTGGNSTLVSRISTDTLTNKTLTSPKINEDVALTATATELNLLDGVSGLVQADFTKLAAIDSTATELNILDGVTATTAELNILDGVTSTTAELNILDGVTSTASELNILDGVTSSTSELNILDGVTATTSELNIMDGVTATTSELNIMDGVTSTTAELNILDGVTATASELNIMDGVTSTTAELNILDGVTASAADINLIDGITNGTVIASKAIITDSNKDISGGRNITISGELDAATLDISGNADIDGTLEADAITVNGSTLSSVIQDEATALAIALG